MQQSIMISKLDAAKRQLETAILLYFNDADPVSIHTLVGAAHGILSNLIEAKGGQSLLKTIIKKHIKKEYHKEVAKIFTSAREHFKHADQNPDFILEFHPNYNDNCLYDACLMYNALTSEQVPYLEIFTFWFYINNQNLFNETPGYKKLFREMKENFGNKRIFFTNALELRSHFRK